MDIKLKESLCQASLVALLASLAAPDVHAHGFKYVSSSGTPLGVKGGSMMLLASPSTIAVGSNRWNILADVIRRLNRGPADVSVALATNTSPLSTRNEINNSFSEAWFSSNESLLSYRHAATWTVVDGARTAILEADIVFSKNLPFRTSSNSIANIETFQGSGSPRPMASTAMHELGHALGLAHEGGTYNQMGISYSHLHIHDGQFFPYMGEDATHGLTKIYGLSGQNEDVSTSPFRFDESTPSSAEYSKHRSNGVVGAVMETLSNGEPIWKVQAGKIYEFEVTLENNGTSTQSPRVQYLFSADDKITKSDILLEQHTPTLARNTVYERTIKLRIPTLYKGGDYCIGVLVDPDDKISETDEMNASYIRIRVSPAKLVATGVTFSGTGTFGF